MDMMETLRADAGMPKKTWAGQYQDVHYEVVKWSAPGSGIIWNYYIVVNLARIPDRDKANELWLEPKPCDFSPGISYDYWETSWNSDIWMHGGCTFYKKTLGLDGEDFRAVKIGCDYKHYQDVSPTLRSCLRDVGKTIDSFIEWAGVYLRRCSGCGTYFQPGTGVENKDGKESRCGGEGDFCSY